MLMSLNSPVSKVVVFLLLFPAISGCMEEEPKEPLEISFSLDSLEGGVFQSLRLTSSARMSVMVPYLVINPGTGYVQNGTVLDFNAGYDTHAIQILGPPGAVDCIFLMAEYGRDDWPVRKTNESWREWIARDGHLQGFDGNIGAKSE
jgi:hypothetical protein